jgi:hypothetical protein
MKECFNYTYQGLAPGRLQSSPMTGFSVHGIVAVPILWRTL